MAKKLEMDAIPAAVREVLSVFADNLADVQFPGVSHQALATLAERVQTAQGEVDAAKERLAEAEQALADARATLVTKTEQGLAYAKIYAHDDAALAKRLNAVPLAKGARQAKKPAKGNAAKPEAVADGRPAAGGKKRKRENEQAPSHAAAEAAPLAPAEVPS